MVSLPVSFRMIVLARIDAPRMRWVRGVTCGRDAADLCHAGLLSGGLADKRLQQA